MGTKEIRADIVAIGKPEGHDLGRANQLLMDLLKVKFSRTMYGFSCYWNSDSKIVYTINLPHVPEHLVDPKIIVYDCPINFKDWSKAMRTGLVPVGFKLHYGPKLVCSLEYSLGNIKGNSLIGWFNNVQDEVHEVYNRFKCNEKGIVPGRELNLLWDNRYTLFDPESFRMYMKKNEDGGLVGYLGDLSD